MIDIVLQGTLANIRTLLIARGLLKSNNTPVSGFDYCLWAGDGKFMTARPVYGNGQFNPPTTPATYLAGLVALCRIAVAGDPISEGPEQWERSQVAKWIKTNGVLGTFGGLPCYTVNNVRMMQAADVFAWCSANSIPAHEWLGGNSL